MMPCWSSKQTQIYILFMIQSTDHDTLPEVYTTIPVLDQCDPRNLGQFFLFRKERSTEEFVQH